MVYGSYRPEDFEAFVIKYENKLYRTALAIMGNAFDAQDIVQEAFINAIKKAPSFETEEHETAWMIRVTVNLCNSRLRSPWRKRATPLLDTYPAVEPQQYALVAYIQALPAKYRIVIHLFYYEGYSVKEIAALIGQKEGTVKSLLSRARQKLKTVLEEDEYENIP